MQRALLMAVVLIAGLLAGCSGGGHVVTADVEPPSAPVCKDPTQTFLFPNGRGFFAMESQTWLGLALDTGGLVPKSELDGRLVEAVVAGGPIWSVEDLWLTPQSAARVMRFTRAHLDSSAPIAARACFLGRHQVFLRQIATATGHAAQRASQLAYGIELAAPSVVGTGGHLLVVLSQGSMYDETYRFWLKGSEQHVAWYAYNQTKNLLYRLTLPTMVSANDQDVFQFVLPHDVVPGTYSLALLSPGMPRTPGTKPGEPGFGWANGRMDGGFTFQVAIR